MKMVWIVLSLLTPPSPKTRQFICHDWGDKIIYRGPCEIARAVEGPECMTPDHNDYNCVTLEELF